MRYRSLVTPFLGMTVAVIPSAVVILSAAKDLHAQDLRVDSNVAIPMRDGVVLRADVFRPTADGRYPTLVYRTPYDKRAADAALSTMRKAVARGYVVVMQDVRGRYASDGEFLPYQQEGKDGYDTIEWAAKQTWSTGAVGTYGLSYPGAVQWLAALEKPPSLKAMVPAMTYASHNQFWYSNGVWDLSWIDWINANIRGDRTRRLGGDTSLRAIAPWYFEWQRHPPEDAWWEWANLAGKYGRTSAAVLNFSAWHDDAYGPHGAIGNYLGLADAHGPRNVGLIMGPWTHGVPRTNRTTAGARDYGPIGTIDYDETVLRWMDRYVRGVAPSEPLPAPVRIFVMGVNRWLEARRWPIPGIERRTLELRRPGASSVLSFDPATPIRDPEPRAGAHDYRWLDTLSGGRVVTFETEPMETNLTVVGAMTVEMHVSVRGSDAQLWAKVLDVAPDGRALSLMSPGLDVVRLSYRNGARKHEPLVPGRFYQVRLGDLLTANTFRKGHRIRVAVMGSFTPWFAAHDSANVITIHHDEARPFRLILPVLPESAILPAKP